MVFFYLNNSLFGLLPYCLKEINLIYTNRNLKKKTIETGMEMSVTFNTLTYFFR